MKQRQMTLFELENKEIQALARGEHVALTLTNGHRMALVWSADSEERLGVQKISERRPGVKMTSRRAKAQKKRQRRTYSKVFKSKALERVKNGEKVSAVARDMKINRSVLDKWRAA